ncbi:MAG: hypothetical protein AABX25_04035 [Nanoarchaeota archaeon]
MSKKIVFGYDPKSHVPYSATYVGFTGSMLTPMKGSFSSCQTIDQIALIRQVLNDTLIARDIEIEFGPEFPAKDKDLVSVIMSCKRDGTVRVTAEGDEIILKRNPNYVPTPVSAELAREILPQAKP